jgi:hypothetical protein
MPLLDHFRPPMSKHRPWESFHATWCSALADLLNRDLPPGYVALEQVSPGAPVEIDVATYDESELTSAATSDGTATLARTVWTPAAPPMLLPAVFPERFTVEIVASEGGRTLVGAIELVSPGNKDRPAKRRLFAAKCATYLARGVGLIIVDVVSTRQANMHNELVNALGLEASYQMAPESALYAAAYRPVTEGESAHIETWPTPLAVGQALPVLPLSLAADLCIPVDLDAAYCDACERRRIRDVLE